MFSSKLICGKCGSIYAPKPWYSTNYNNLVWQCHRRHVKKNKHLAFNIYDKMHHFFVHEIATDIICKRNIEETVADAVRPLISKEQKDRALKWLRDFRVRDIWKLQSDEEDIALIINKIVVMVDGTAKVNLIDESVMPFTLTDLSPEKYKAEKQKGQMRKKKSVKRPTVKTSTIVTECDNCGAVIKQYVGRKPKRFCCNECRNQWWNQHFDQVKRKTYYEITCQHCGKIITVYGDSRRKYLSHEFYIEARFGK